VIRAAALPIALAIGLCGCAARSASHWDRPVEATALPSVGPVFVMEPIVSGTAAPGNVGRDFASIKSAVAARILAVVRERFSQARIAGTLAPMGARLPPGYPRSTDQGAATPEEINAAISAYQAGATHLIVSSIGQWTEMRTDDPIGALIGTHNRVAVTLKLMRLEPPAVAGQVTFTNQARLTLNQKAIGLLDERFRSAILRLISGRA
jgi:hypothetical protein